MTTNDEIAKLAREYAEEIYGKELSNTLAFSREKDEMEANIRWLLRTHCIVSKEKVNEAYQKTQAQIKDGRELGIHCLVTSGGAKEALLESLFDAETFKNSEV